MARKKKDEKGSCYKDYVITDIEDWDGFAVDWDNFPQEILDEIPKDMFYNVPFILPSGRVEEKTVIYLFDREECCSEKVTDDEFQIFPLPEHNIRILIFL